MQLEIGWLFSDSGGSPIAADEFNLLNAKQFTVDKNIAPLEILLKKYYSELILVAVIENAGAGDFIKPFLITNYAFKTALLTDVKSNIQVLLACNNAKAYAAGDSCDLDFSSLPFWRLFTIW